MDEKQKNDGKKVMLVEDANDGKLKAVTDVDRDGNIQTVEPAGANAASLLDVNTHDSMLEAFFKKFMQETQNPSHTGIFMMAESVLGKLIKIDFAPEELEKHRVDPAAELQNRQRQEGEPAQSFQPMDVSKIDRADMERKGIRWEDMEPHLKAMSYGHKSNKLIEMSPELEPGGTRVPTKGRVSLEEQADGTLKVVPHYWQDKPDLDAPLYNILLDDQAKENLLKTNHAGRAIDLELSPGNTVPCYISLDRLTNRLEVLPVSLLQSVTNIKGKELTEGQRLDFAAGKKVLVEGMTSRAGRLFDGYVQVNAADRNFEFSYDGLDRKRYAQENKEIARQQKSGKQENRQELPADGMQKQVFIPKKLLGAELDEKQIQRLESGKPAYVKGMLKDGQDQPFNAWVKPNYEKGKMDFYKYNPDYVRKQGGEVKPAEESKAQVAVNSEGKTNEATKHVKEPLKQGQQQPTGEQRKQQEQRQRPPARRNAPAKGKGQSGPKI